MLIPVVLATSAQFIGADKWWVPPTLALFYPVWFIIPFGWGVYWIRTSKGMLLVNLLILGLNYNHLWDTFQLSYANNPRDKDLKVVSFNVASFDYQPDQARKMGNYFEKQHPDIVCLQEFRVNLSQAGQKELESISYLKKKWNLKYHAFQNYAQEKDTKDDYGLIIFSKYPIRTSGLVGNTGKNALNGIMYADIELYGEVMRIYNVHLQSYQFDSNQRQLIDAPDRSKKLSFSNTDENNIFHLVQNDNSKKKQSSNKTPAAQSSRRRIDKQEFSEFENAALPEEKRNPRLRISKDNSKSDLTNKNNSEKKPAHNGRVRKSKINLSNPEEDISSSKESSNSNKLNQSTVKEEHTNENSKSKSYWSMVKKMIRTWKIHTQQVESYLEHKALRIAEEQCEPFCISITCGDLNNTPYSNIYRSIRGQQKDAFCTKGNGFGTTFGEGIFKVRIDYIFTTDHFHILDYKTISGGKLSDHNAIAARLRFKFHKK